MNQKAIPHGHVQLLTPGAQSQEGQISWCLRRLQPTASSTWPSGWLSARKGTICCCCSTLLNSCWELLQFLHPSTCSSKLDLLLSFSRCPWSQLRWHQVIRAGVAGIQFSIWPVRCASPRCVGFNDALNASGGCLHGCKYWQIQLIKSGTMI